MPKRWWFEVLLACDRLAAAMLGAWSDESLSSYAYRLDKQGVLWGSVWRNLIDWWFLATAAQIEHCRGAYLFERWRAYVPPMNRATNRATNRALR